jgi:hypothetical protein
MLDRGRSGAGTKRGVRSRHQFRPAVRLRVFSNLLGESPGRPGLGGGAATGRVPGQRCGTRARPARRSGEGGALGVGAAAWEGGTCRSRAAGRPPSSGGGALSWRRARAAARAGRPGGPPSPGRGLGTTLFTVLLAGFQLLLSPRRAGRGAGGRASVGRDRAALAVIRGLPDQSAGAARRAGRGAHSRADCWRGPRCRGALAHQGCCSPAGRAPHRLGAEAVASLRAGDPRLPEHSATN